MYGSRSAVGCACIFWGVIIEIIEMTEPQKRQGTITIITNISVKNGHALPISAGSGVCPRTEAGKCHEATNQIDTPPLTTVESTTQNGIS